MAQPQMQMQAPLQQSIFQPMTMEKTLLPSAKMANGNGIMDPPGQPWNAIPQGMQSHGQALRDKELEAKRAPGMAAYQTYPKQNLNKGKNLGDPICIDD